MIDRIECISKGTVLRVKKSLHTIENASDNCAEFIVFRKGSNR